MRARLTGILASLAAIVPALAVLTVAPANGATGNLTTVVGPIGIADGPQLTAHFNEPGGVDVHGGVVYVADTRNHRIRKIDGGVVTTIAGTGLVGSSGDGGSPTQARLNEPRDVAVSADGNTIYIADTGNNKIRMISGGVITTIAGTGSGGFGGDGGDASLALFNRPYSLTVDDAGKIYVADSTNHRIRKIDTTVAPYSITTVAGDGTSGDSSAGPGTSSPLNNPQGVEVKPDGSVLYIADTWNHKLLQLNTGTSYLSVLMGDGTPSTTCSGGAAVSTLIYAPTQVSLDGSSLYVSSWGDNKICKITLGGFVQASLFAGTGSSAFGGDSGSPTGASIWGVGGLASSGGTVYIADTYNNRIRYVASDVIDTLAGDGTWGTTASGSSTSAARMRQPAGLVVTASGVLYVADRFNHRILRVESGTVTIVAGNSTSGFSGDADSATSAQLSSPYGVAVDNAGNIYIADTRNNRIRRVRVSDGKIFTIAGGGGSGYDDDSTPITAIGAKMNTPLGIAVTGDGSVVYFADAMNNRIRKITLADGKITTIAGSDSNGYDDDSTPITAIGARMNFPSGVTIAPNGVLYVSDSSNGRIRKITLADGKITTVAGGGSYGHGDGDPATSVVLSSPTSTALDANGNLYIAEYGNYGIRRVATDGTIITVAGTGKFGFSGENIAATTSALGNIYGIGIDASGNVYASDETNHRVFRLETAASAVTTIPTTTSSTPSSLLVTRAGVTPKAIATYLKMSIPKGARFAIVVARTSKKSCAVKRGKLASLKTGSCRFTISVKPTKGATKKKTTTLVTQ